MKIKGVDLSYCQEGISFPALKQAGVRFAIIRAGFPPRKMLLWISSWRTARNMALTTDFTGTAMQ